LRDGTADTTLGQCSNWTSTSGTVLAGAINGTTDVWSQYSVVPCSKALPIYCFGVDYKGPLQRGKSSGRWVFISKGLFAPKLGGSIDDADGICLSEAQAAGFAGSYKAFLGLSNAPPTARFDLAGTRWVRPDDVVVTSDWIPRIDTPVNVTLDKNYLGDVGVFVGGGATADGGVDPVTTTCSDWSSPAGTASGGRAPFVDDNFMQGQILDCSVGHHVYCLQE
jgi:hypothetical protein